MKVWRRLDDGSDVTHAGYRDIVHKRFRMNNGREIKADIAASSAMEAAGVIALTKDNEVIVATQYRCGPEKNMHEMPGGAVDPGETPEQAARRELREEVGYKADELEYLGCAYPSAWETMTHHYYLAKNCQYVGPNSPEEYEEIEVNKPTIKDFIANAKNAKMTDAQGVFLAYDILKELEKQ